MGTRILLLLQEGFKTGKIFIKSLTLWQAKNRGAKIPRIRGAGEGVQVFCKPAITLTYELNKLPPFLSLCLKSGVELHYMV